MRKRCHILMFIGHLGTGGAEKHLVRVANHLDRGAFRLSMALVRADGSYQAELASDVDLHVLGAGMRRAITPLARLIRRLRPDLVFSIMDAANVTALAAAALVPDAPPVVVGIQIPVTIELRRQVTWGKRVLRLALPWLYPRARAIVALSEGVRDDVTRWLPQLAGRIRVIYNAGFDARVLAQAAEPAEPPHGLGDGPIVVACGRLVEQKGFAYLLEAFARLRGCTPAKLWILGDGPLRAVLGAHALALGVAPHVWFAGFRHNPYALLHRADVFALSSLWEGFANVIVEAMAVGTPVVATDCPHGPAEIIRSEMEGLLVPPADSGALADALVRVLADAALRERLARGGRARAENFSAERIARQYGEVFLEASGKRGAASGLAA